MPVAVVEPVQFACQNPVLLAGQDSECVWETVVDVIDDYFRIEREEPVRQWGGVLTEGRLETQPEVGATIFEPWRRDSVGGYQRLESTLQSIRRYALVRVLPAEGGFWVEVAVYKELEDVLQPENATAGGATFRNDSSYVRVENPIGGQEVHRGWIPLGRDAVLEQEILAQFQSRYGTTGIRVPTLGL